MLLCRTILRSFWRFKRNRDAPLNQQYGGVRCRVAQYQKHGSSAGLTPAISSVFQCAVRSTAVPNQPPRKLMTGTGPRWRADGINWFIPAWARVRHRQQLAGALNSIWSLIALRGDGGGLTIRKVLVTATNKICKLIWAVCASSMPQGVVHSRCSAFTLRLLAGAEGHAFRSAVKNLKSSWPLVLSAMNQSAT